MAVKPIQELLPGTFAAAHWWQCRGWGVLPVQPGSKHLIPGFGQYAGVIDTGEAVEFWFRSRRCNLAVVAPESGVLLDFDDIAQYKRFCEIAPMLAESLTESTPRGGMHVFLETSQPFTPGLTWQPGIEIKRVAVVSPSQIGGKSYKSFRGGQIVRGAVPEALRAFLAEGGNKSPLQSPARLVGLPVGKYTPSRDKQANHGILARVKSNWGILEYLIYFEPRLILSGSGRWRVGRCPWHEDHRPSLWVDVDRNLWGCHACHARGDVVNWHARRLGIDDQLLAARDLATYRVEVIA